MREFICGYQSLISCGMEVIGFVLFALIFGGLMLVYVAERFGAWRRHRAGNK